MQGITKVGAATPNNRSYSPNFKAVVNVNAIPTLLNETAVKELKEMGKKIGDNNTKINLQVGYVKNNPYVYNVSHKTEVNINENFKKENISFETNEDVVTPTMTPFDYAKNLMGRISKFVNQNTSY